MTSKIPMAVIALIAVIGGLGTGMAVNLSMGSGSPFDLGGGDDEAGGAAEAPVIQELGDFMLNLAEPGGARLLRMQLQVEATPAALARIEQIEPRIRDDILRWTSDRTYASIEGAAGKEQLRTELLARINAILEPQKVENVYFYTLIVQ